MKKATFLEVSLSICSLPGVHSRPLFCNCSPSDLPLWGPVDVHTMKEICYFNAGSGFQSLGTKWK